jgi:hypothetical protein
MGQLGEVFGTAVHVQQHPVRKSHVDGRWCEAVAWSPPQNLQLGFRVGIYLQ